MSTTFENMPQELQAVKGLLLNITNRLDTFNQVEPEQLFTMDEAAAFCKVNRKTLANYEREGFVIAYLFGNEKRYKKSEIVNRLIPLIKTVSKKR